MILRLVMIKWMFKDWIVGSSSGRNVYQGTISGLRERDNRMLCIVFGG
jgi:hypothetical protein